MFNKTLSKSNAIKKIAILTTIVSVFLVGCGSDQNYKREVDGNEDYLQSPALKPLIIPQGVTVPAETNDYYVDNNEVQGALGKKLDIRPPVLPIPTIADAFADYSNGAVTFNTPLSDNVWGRIGNVLTNKNIPIKHSDNKSITTDKAFIVRADEEQSIEASYVFNREVLGQTETITLRLTSLTRGNEDILSQPIEVQRYVVGLFNDIMDEVAPESLRVVPRKTDNDENTGAEQTERSSLSQELKEDLKN